MEQLLTVIVQTSPIPSHPSTALLEALFRSFQKVDGLLESKIVILCDGCEETTGGEKENVKHGKASSETASRYREHLKLLRVAVEEHVPPFVAEANGSIELLVLPERHGSARGIAAAFSSRYNNNAPAVVETPLVMICQHDNFFVQNVPLRPCLYAMHQNPGLGIGLKCLHFMSTATLNYKTKVQKRYDLDIDERSIEIEGMETPAKLVPLVFWYGRTHLSYTEHYTANILNRPLKTGDHLEELLGVTELEDIRRRGVEAAHGDYGTFVLDQGCGEVIYHLSGRRVRAAAGHLDDNAGEKTDQEHHPKASADTNTTPTAPIEATDGSFTTARSCRAIVPGLEIVSESRSSNPKGKFRQKCFHCGQKGHSYKFCPSLEDKLSTETIDLS